MQTKENSVVDLNLFVIFVRDGSWLFSLLLSYITSPRCMGRGDACFDLVPWVSNR